MCGGLEALSLAVSTDVVPIRARRGAGSLRRHVTQPKPSRLSMTSPWYHIGVMNGQQLLTNDVVHTFIGTSSPHARDREYAKATAYLRREREAFCKLLRAYVVPTSHSSAMQTDVLSVELFRDVVQKQFSRRLGRDAYLSGAVRVDPSNRRLMGDSLPTMKALLGSTDGPLFLQFLNGVSEVARINIEAIA